jgi:cellulose biosynthesis protein BcsQ
MTKIIAIFNTKGGVGKTTLAINIGSQLALMGKRVILVDADFKCNLTTFFKKVWLDVSEVMDDECNVNKNIEQVLQDKLNLDFNQEQEAKKISFENVNPNLFSILDPIFEKNQLESGDVHLEQLNFNELYTESNNKKGQLWLLPGSSQILRLQEKLNETNLSHRAMRYHGSFRYILTKASNQVKADYILVDLSSSTGNLNRTLVMSCDFILAPVWADEFSCSSIDSFLSSLLPLWIDWANDYRAQENRLFKEAKQNTDDLKRFKFNSENPRILPFLANSYKLFKNKITTACSLWLFRIINNAKRIKSESSYETIRNMITFENDLLVCLVPHLGQSISRCSSISTPLPLVQNKDTEIFNYEPLQKEIIKRRDFVRERLISYCEALEKIS